LPPDFFDADLEPLSDFGVSLFVSGGGLESALAADL
jgi:hypothetical protein